MTAATPERAPLQPVDSVYLYHWRFDRGEEFGLYRHKADADSAAANRAAEYPGEGLSEVLGMAVLDRPQPQPVADLEAAFASGLRVRTAPCTVDAHDREHLQVRTNRHWLCGHLLAGLLIDQGIVAGPEPQPAPELAEADRIIRDILESLCRRDGLSLESTVVPGEPARNYALAERLGIGHVFGLPDAAPAEQQSAPDLATTSAAAGESDEMRAVIDMIWRMCQQGEEAAGEHLGDRITGLIKNSGMEPF